MKNRIRLFAGSVTLAGAALLTTATPAHSTMARVVLDPLGGRYCCGFDSDRDGRAETYCCFATGCTVGPAGCQRI